MNDRGLGRFVFGVGGFLHSFGQAVEIFRLMQMVGQDVIPDGQHHAAKLGAPISNVVLADDPVLLEFKNPADGVADDRAAEMADVHFLGDVWAGIIDHDGLGLGDRRDSQASVRDNCVELRCQPGRGEADVDEAGAGDRDFRCHIPQLEPGADFLGDRGGIQLLAGLFTHGFNQTHGGVGLIIAEFFVLADADLRIAGQIKRVQIKRVLDGGSENAV